MADFDNALRVIIVEDDRLSAQEIDRYLTAIGYDVVDVLKTTDKALVSATQHKPDFIIMGVQVAGPRDGIEAAQEIFSKLGIRCLFASGQVDAAIRTRAEFTKPLGWLRKPYSTENLLLVLSTARRRLVHS
jgi:two-component system, response regulator PdtaR